MNRERAKELLPIIEAFANGEEIQRKAPDGEWTALLEKNVLYDTDTEYRIRPKPLEVFMHINRKSGKVVGFNHKSETMRQDPKIIHKLFREVLE